MATVMLVPLPVLLPVSPSTGSFDAAQASSLPCKANAWVAMAVSSLGVGLLGSRRETLTPWALAGAAAQAVLKPTASRHPWALVAGASLLGAGLVMVRPWRLVGRRGIWGNLAVQLAWQGLRQASAAAALRATSSPPSSPSSPRPSQR